MSKKAESFVSRITDKRMFHIRVNTTTVIIEFLTARAEDRKDCNARMARLAKIAAEIPRLCDKPLQ